MGRCSAPSVLAVKLAGYNVGLRPRGATGALAGRRLLPPARGVRDDDVDFALVMRKQLSSPGSDGLEGIRQQIGL